MKYYISTYFIFFILFSGFCQKNQSSEILKSNIKLLLTTNEIDIRESPLFFNGNDLIVVKDRKIFTFSIEGENNSVSMNFLPKEINKLEQIVNTSDNNSFIKDKNTILQINNTRVTIFMEMPHKDFSIYPADEKNFYIVIQENGNSELFLINIETKALTKLLSYPEQITDVVGTGDKTILAIGNNIFLLENKKTILIYHNEIPIKSLAGSEYGLFIASEKELSYLCLPFVVVPVIEENIQKVMCANNTLIVLMGDGRLFKVDNANSFENRIRAFVNEKK